MEALKLLYSTLWSDRSKERFEMILEPLQAMTQLALLSFYPVGTKVSISENVLHIQEPSWSQGVRRSYNSDKKEDLMFLFGVITRFHKFYSEMKDKSKEHMELFNLLLELSKTGIKNLVQTYERNETTHLTQTLKMYISIIDNPTAFSMVETATDKQQRANIDTVFKQITELYDEEYYFVILYNLRLIKKDSLNYIHYSHSIHTGMTPVNKKLMKWISDNIVF